MLRFVDLKSRKAEKIRWETVRSLDWEKDNRVIEMIANVENPRFFTTRTPEKILADIEEKIKLEDLIAREIIKRESERFKSVIYG